MKEAKLRQLSLLQTSDYKPLPKDSEAEALEFLVQLLIAVLPAIEEGKRDEQDQQ